jgi:hypothetical protein
MLMKGSCSILNFGSKDISWINNWIRFLNDIILLNKIVPKIISWLNYSREITVPSKSEKSYIIN